MRTVCIYHGIDLDGWMSAAIVKHWYLLNQRKEQEAEIALNIKVESVDTIDFIGYNYGQPIPDLSMYDKVIMCDISFPKKEMELLAYKSWENKSHEFIWIDHHISAIKENNNLVFKGLQDVDFAACELTWKYFFPNETMPEIVRLLGRYDCFGHRQIWKAVPNYEGLYEVSNHGNVRSLDRIIIENNTGKERHIKGIDLSIANSTRGYRVVVLCKNGTEKMRNVHKLVAEAFIPNPENKPCINHKDFNRLNNHVNNLEWCTYLENNLHSIEEGVRGKTVIQLSQEDQVIEIFDSIHKAEKVTGVANQNISKVCKGERKYAGGFKWEYGIDKNVFRQFVPVDEETKVLEFQYGARSWISNYEEAYEALLSDIEFRNDFSYSITSQIYEKGMAIYEYLCTDAKQSYENGFEVSFDYYTEPYQGNEDGYHKLKFICINKERFNPINFGIDYHKDGYDGCACFYRRSDGKWSFSLYNDNGEIDCSVIAKQYGGGGHRGASGFIVDDINSILK